MRVLTIPIRVVYYSDTRGPSASYADRPPRKRDSKNHSACAPQIKAQSLTIMRYACGPLVPFRLA